MRYLKKNLISRYQTNIINIVLTFGGISQEYDTSKLSLNLLLMLQSWEYNVKNNFISTGSYYIDKLFLGKFVITGKLRNVIALKVEFTSSEFAQT